MSSSIKKIIFGLAGASILATAANAGGLERGGYNIDLLFDDSRAAFDATGAYVMPQRQLKNVQDTDASDGIGSDGIGGGTTTADETESYFVPRVGLKVGFTEDLNCMADYSQPYGAHTNPGANWMGANSNIETKIDSDGFAATCSYSFDAGPGKLRIIGGVSYLEMSGFKERLVAPAFAAVGNGVGRLELSDSGYGWRAGLAYEVPEIALRASLMYYSEVELDDVTGILDLSQVNGAIVPVFGSTAMPEAIELKVQSGVAPGWLVFGSVKWVDWSQLQNVSFCPEATRALVANCTYNGGTRVTSLDLLYQDGWTVSAGVGHQLTEKVSLAGSITWDRGTGTGVGTQTDTWTFGFGGSYKPTENAEFRLGGAIGVLTSGSSGTVTTDNGTFGTDVAYDFGSDVVSAVSASFKVKF
jgi:long-chain fatty acid transport protein